MSAKDSITTQTCKLLKEEFNDFLILYPIPSEYRVILPKSNQTVFDAPPGFKYRGSTILVVPNSPLLSLSAKLMVVSPLSTFSEGSSICVELVRIYQKSHENHQKRANTDTRTEYGPHDTQNCMENPEQAFVEYASLRTDEAKQSQDARLSKFEADFKRQQVNAITIHPKQPEESQVNKPEVKQEEDNPEDTNSNPYSQPDPLAFITIEQVQKLNSMLESLRLVPQSSNTKFVCFKEDDGEVMFIEIIRDDDEPQNEDPNK
ncbi:hypothetical protein Tco_0108788 [Tanacetum coccineum]